MRSFANRGRLTDSEQPYTRAQAAAAGGREKGMRGSRCVRRAVLLRGPAPRAWQRDAGLRGGAGACAPWPSWLAGT